MNRTDIQADVVSRILEALETSDELFWRKPWSVHKNAGPLAYSMSSGKPYQGINSLILMCARWKFGWESKWFGTFNQIRAKGGSVLKGEKSVRVILFKKVTKKTEDENSEQQETFALMRSFSVFNAGQTNLSDYQVDEPEEADNLFERHEVAEQLIANTGYKFHVGHSAHYCPTTDEITLPPRHRFESPEAFYETAFHELAHAVESKTGFDRKLAGNTYGFGELVAELTAVNVMAHLQLETQASTENSAAYLQHWIRSLRENHSVIFKAAAQSAKATEYLLRFAPQDDAVPTIGMTPVVAMS